jgi:hypothetical protein
MRLEGRREFRPDRAWRGYRIRPTSGLNPRDRPG